MPYIQALCLDFDGTLVDSEWLHAEAWQCVLSHWSIEFSKEAFVHRFSGVPLQDTAQAFIMEYDLAIDIASLCQDKTGAYADLLLEKGHSICKGANELIETLYGSLPIAVVTGSSRKEAIPAITAQGWSEKFDFVICGDDVEQSKPNPQGYLMACERFQCDPEQVVAIEDSSTGVSAALAAGLRTLLVPSLPLDRVSQGIEAELADLHQALDWLRKQEIAPVPY